MDRQELIEELLTLFDKPVSANGYGAYSIAWRNRDEAKQLLREVANLLEVCHGCAYCFRMQQETETKKEVSV